MTRPRDEWLADVMGRYKALEQFSKEDARLQFLRILRSLPYGNSIFFSVKRIEDPIGLLPAKLILGINKRGVHFFRPVPKEYLHSAELRDIMQFGSSTQVLYPNLSSLHVLQGIVSLKAECSDFRPGALSGSHGCPCALHVTQAALIEHSRSLTYLQSERDSTWSQWPVASTVCDHGAIASTSLRQAAYCLPSISILLVTCLTWHYAALMFVAIVWA